MITKEQAKDLRPLKVGEMVLDGTFYKKENNGSFSRCSISKKEWEAKPLLRTIIFTALKEGILFIRLGKPWASFI